MLDGADALDRLSVTRYDVVVLDRDLPGVNGDEVCRRMVEQRLEARVLMLTAELRQERVLGLELGADDYLAETVRFHRTGGPGPALGRRAPSAQPVRSPMRDLVLDPARRMASRGGRPLALSPKEFAVLECLLAVGRHGSSRARSSWSGSGTTRLIRSPLR